MRTGVQWLAHLCGTYLAQPVLFPFTISGDLLQHFAQIEGLKSANLHEVLTTRCPSASLRQTGGGHGRLDKEN